MKELLTASRMSSLLSCPRKHYYKYELGLTKTEPSMALRIGSAWHRAMEARWHGKNHAEALESAVGDKSITEEYVVALLSAMLSVYYEKYASDASDFSGNAEHEFRYKIAGSSRFIAAGKIDFKGTYQGRSCILEHKTTTDSLGEDSRYWDRVRCSPQTMQYVLSENTTTTNIQVVLYDVAHVGRITPQSIPLLDENGFKMVYDAQGQRQFLKDGKPRQSAGEGMSMAKRDETPGEYFDRMLTTIRENPDVYFQRKEMPVLQDDIDEFLAQRIELSKLILSMKRRQKKCVKPWHAWPRNANGLTCRSCEYEAFCLQNIHVTDNSVPVGYAIGPLHPELNTTGNAKQETTSEQITKEG